MSTDLHITWQRYYRRPGIWLRVHPDMLVGNVFGSDIFGKKLDIIAVWCSEQGCGKRMSYDQWQFKNEAEITMFLLKWS